MIKVKPVQHIPDGIGYDITENNHFRINFPAPKIPLALKLQFAGETAKIQYLVCHIPNCWTGSVHVGFQKGVVILEGEITPHGSEPASLLQKTIVEHVMLITDFSRMFSTFRFGAFDFTSTHTLKRSIPLSQSTSTH